MASRGLAQGRVAVGLVHHPVVDKNGREISSAVTPTDLHDLARSARTYGVESLWIVTPLRDQQKLAARMMGFWQEGVGAGYNPNRGQALDLVRIVDSLELALLGQGRIWEEEPLVWGTSAQRGVPGGLNGRLGFGRAREIIGSGRPVLLLFGTAWGMAPPALDKCDDLLEPLSGPGEYNHLSVRSAAAVVLDRLLGRSEGD